MVQLCRVVIKYSILFLDHDICNHYIHDNTTRNQDDSIAARRYILFVYVLLLEEKDFINNLHDMVTNQSWNHFLIILMKVMKMITLSLLVSISLKKSFILEIESEYFTLPLSCKSTERFVFGSSKMME